MVEEVYESFAFATLNPYYVGFFSIMVKEIIKLKIISRKYILNKYEIKYLPTP